MKVSHSTVNCHSVHRVPAYLGESYEHYREPTNNYNIFTDVEHLFWPFWAFYTQAQRVQVLLCIFHVIPHLLSQNVCWQTKAGKT